MGLGQCLTNDVSQGVTVDHSILALPRGSKGVDSLKGYVGASRHRLRSWIVTSLADEAAQIAGGRPLGVNNPVTFRHLQTNLHRE